MAMRVTELDGSIGAEIDFDFDGEWSDDIVSSLQDTFKRRHLLVMHAPDLTAEHHVRLIESLGLENSGEWPNGEKFGFLSTNSGYGEREHGANSDTALADDRHNPYLYHSDRMCSDRPLSAISLYALALPDHPTPTSFANGVAAAASLPPDVRDEFAELEAVFLVDYKGGSTRYREQTASANAQRATRPILYDDPISQQTSLIVDSLFMARIVGMDDEASELIRERAHDYLYNPENVYAHDWKVGDLVVWNNVALQHARPKLPATGERTHRRVSAYCPR
jgi:taurine dioxygenase